MLFLPAPASAGQGHALLRTDPRLSERQWKRVRRMPREFRMIIFDDHEVWDALRRTAVSAAQAVDQQRMLRFEVAASNQPSASIFSAIYRDMVDEEQSVSFSETVVRNALIGSCLKRRVRLPVDANKDVHVIEGKLALVIRLHGQDSR